MNRVGNPAGLLYIQTARRNGGATGATRATGGPMADGSASEVWSFFSGAMGFDLGLEQGGLVPTLANEIDPRCCETIRLNRPGLQLIQDSIEDLDAERLRKVRGFHGDVDLM
ncbi:MAG: DNA cytosine methyltransferase, partial [Gammaproteobacteria bacterium]|nr:DNA cytosine methyltransferase [Gammaproteobacteria bacterium]